MGNHRRRIGATLCSVGLTAGALIGTATAADATASTETCAPVVTIAARGTTTGSDTSLGDLGKLATSIQTKTKYGNRIKNLDYHSTNTGIGGTGYFGDVTDGESRLRTVLTNINNACGTSTNFVLIGYSKGANVVTNVLDDQGTQLPSRIDTRIKAVVVWGDPTRHPNDPIHYGTAGRNEHGALERVAGHLTHYASRIHSYCDTGDPVCALPGTNMTVHESYERTHLTDATSFVIGKLGK